MLQRSMATFSHLAYTTSVEDRWNTDIACLMCLESPCIFIFALSASIKLQVSARKVEVKTYCLTPTRESREFGDQLTPLTSCLRGLCAHVTMHGELVLLLWGSGAEGQSPGQRVRALCPWSWKHFTVWRVAQWFIAQYWHRQSSCVVLGCWFLVTHVYKNGWRDRDETWHEGWELASVTLC